MDPSIRKKIKTENTIVPPKLNKLLGNKMKTRTLIVLFCLTLFSSPLIAKDNRIDGLRPDAPELAILGPFKIGVRTLKLIHKDQIDAINIKIGKPFPLYDRPLTVEVWYPANTPDIGGVYKSVYLRDGKTQVNLYGTAVRDAVPLDGKAYPLIIISHGYPGNRYLMSHFGENLASKGYIVASIDHTDSNYEDAGPFPSTLFNRPHDQKFILDEMTRMNALQGHFLENKINTNQTGLIGYSMGGYGALITAGAGVTKNIAQTAQVSPNGLLNDLVENSNTHETLLDSRFKAIVAISPWGMEHNFWSDQGLANIRKPMFFISGSVDDVSGYESGTKLIYEKVVNSNRYLLTFENGNHNSAAPIPAPLEAWTAIYNNGKSVAFSHYTDPVWDQLRMNNIAQHFVTAYFSKILKNNIQMDTFLNFATKSIDGKEKIEWKGFENQSNEGLTLEYLNAR